MEEATGSARPSKGQRIDQQLEEPAGQKGFAADNAMVVDTPAASPSPFVLPAIPAVPALPAQSIQQPRSGPGDGPQHEGAIATLVAGPSQAGYAVAWQMVRPHVYGIANSPHLQIPPMAAESMPELLHRIHRLGEERPYLNYLLEGPRNVNRAIGRAVQDITTDALYPLHLVGPLARRLVARSVEEWSTDDACCYHIPTGFGTGAAIGVLGHLATGWWAAFTASPVGPGAANVKIYAAKATGDLFAMGGFGGVCPATGKRREKGCS